jgi:mannose-6-phosphate isomerase-like protein (cupin superfamily)
MAGSGTVTVGTERAPIAAGDAVPVRPGEIHSFASDAAAELELMIIGITTQKGVVD